MFQLPDTVCGPTCGRVWMLQDETASCQHLLVACGGCNLEIVHGLDFQCLSLLSWNFSSVEVLHSTEECAWWACKDNLWDNFGLPMHHAAEIVDVIGVPPNLEVQCNAICLESQTRAQKLEPWQCSGRAEQLEHQSCWLTCNARRPNHC